MALHESAEMYLETIYQLSMEQHCVRSIDVAESLNYSRASVSRAVGLLKKDGYLEMDEDGFLNLTSVFAGCTLTSTSSKGMIKSKTNTGKHLFINLSPNAFATLAEKARSLTYLPLIIIV